jgi:hypothetical protein
VATFAGAVATFSISAGTSHAGLDNELSAVDGKGRTLDIQQWDTFLNGVSALDRNRRTPEWFNSGRAVYHGTGRAPATSEAPWSSDIRSAFPGR